MLYCLSHSIHKLGVSLLNVQMVMLHVRFKGKRISMYRGQFDTCYTWL